MYVVVIELTQEKVALISPEDADLALHKWQATNNPNRVGGKPKRYACRWVKGEKHYLHRVVLARKLGRKVRSDRVVDHGPDTDSLNCLRENLSEVTQATNVKRMHKLKRMNLEP